MSVGDTMNIDRGSSNASGPDLWLQDPRGESSRRAEGCQSFSPERPKSKFAVLCRILCHGTIVGPHRLQTYIIYTVYIYIYIFKYAFVFVSALFGGGGGWRETEGRNQAHFEGFATCRLVRLQPGASGGMEPLHRRRRAPQRAEKLNAFP